MWSVVRLIIQVSKISNRIGYLKFWLYFQTFKIPKRIGSLKLWLKFQTSILSNIQTFKLPNVLEV